MPLSSMARRVVATIALVGLIFQTALATAQLSIVIAARSHPTGAFLLGVICSEHGAATLPAEEAPKDLPSSCALCPVCLTFAAVALAVLPPGSFSVLKPTANRMESFPLADRLFAHRSTPPRSRGPPGIA
jgi:DUF2946 family protein